MAKIDLLAALDGATEKDLAEIDGQIETLEKKLDGLREVRKLLDVRLHGRPVRQAAPADEGGDSDSMEGRRIRLENYLRVRGPSKRGVIAADLDIPISSLYHVARDERFEKTPDGWALAGGDED